MAAARCAAAVKYKKPYYFLALDTAWRGDDDDGGGATKSDGGHGRIVARILHSLTLNILHKYYLFSFAILRLLKNFVWSLIFFAKMIYDLLRFTYENDL